MCKDNLLGVAVYIQGDDESLASEAAALTWSSWGFGLLWGTPSGVGGPWPQASKAYPTYEGIN